LRVGKMADVLNASIAADHHVLRGDAQVIGAGLPIRSCPACHAISWPPAWVVSGSIVQAKASH
jgi:hypothetical protein